jgi:hypothetical protein
MLMRVTYEFTEKFRAEVLKHLGYVLCTPCCLIILKAILLELSFSVNILISFVISFLMLIVGVRCVCQGYSAMEKLDLRKELKHE